jgi:hypothetical protein
LLRGLAVLVAVGLPVVDVGWPAVVVAGALVRAVAEVVGVTVGLPGGVLCVADVPPVTAWFFSEPSPLWKNT